MNGRSTFLTLLALLLGLGGCFVLGTVLQVALASRATPVVPTEVPVLAPPLIVSATPPPTVTPSPTLTPSATPSMTPSPTPSPTVTRTPSATPTPTPEPLSYTVREGDTFSGIALLFQLDLESLVAANPGVDPELLEVGDVLLLPEESVLPPTATPTPVLLAYEVQVGDTLLTIAERYGASLEAILAANPGFDPDAMQVGDEIFVPVP